MAFVYDRTFTVTSVITRLSEAGAPEGEDEISTFSVPGFEKKGEGVSTFSYTEVGENGKTFCDVVVSSEGVTVQRHGACECVMHFGEEDCTCTYGVSAYVFDLHLHTRKIRNRLGEEKRSLDLYYDMRIGGADAKVHFTLAVGG